MTVTPVPPVRVAVLMVSFRPDGGAENLVRTLIGELADDGFEFELYTMRRVTSERAGDIDRLGVPRRAFPARRLVGPIRFARLVRALRSGQFDVIHTHLPAANILGMIAGALVRVPVVATLHNTRTKSDDHWYQGRLETWLLRRLAAQVIAVGDQTASVRREVLGPRIRVNVLHNAVDHVPSLDPARREELRSSIMANPSRRLLIAVGRLTDQKAHDDLLSALAIVRRTDDAIELAIAGRGPRLPDLQRQIDEAGLHDVVHLLGMRRDVRELLRVADVFVKSSRWEGLPVALLEAMEAELPVVATDVGDVADVLADGCARIVPAGDVEGLASAICATVAELDEIDPTVNRRLVEERYSSDAWAQQMAAYYTGAVEGGVPSIIRSRRRPPDRT